MRRWQTVLAVAIAALWVAVGSHCLLEALAGFNFFACEQHTQATGSPTHSDRDCGDDGCWAIESGSYQAQRPLNAPARPLLVQIASLSALIDLCHPDTPAASLSNPPPPPKLIRLWQFYQRAALPPRAPTFVS